MEKDINILLDTTNQEIFDEQAKNWPGVGIVKKYGWECRCHDKHCFMHCIQSLGELFATRSEYETYLNNIVYVTSRDELRDGLVMAAMDHPATEKIMRREVPDFDELMESVRHRKFALN